ncbi:MAG: ATP-binding protein [Oscillospiraceae bacterium]|jgi:AAA+ ATPase superfamily predicted ATPase|nr:ATP-binding protein [Oscillospiraceae bacterium]
MFIGREQELRFFEDKYHASGGQLLMLYGRRRVGKTELLRKFCKGKPHVFYTCREATDTEQIRAFSERVLSSGIPAARYISVFPDWEAALRAITELPSSSEKKLLVIDEFPYMCKGNPSIPSLLQNLWDELLKDQNVMLILCGSAMSFIEKELLSEKKPLYGRATGIYKMNEMPFYDAIKFFPNYADEDKVLAYSVLGGIPHYLRQFDERLSLDDNIIKNVLTKGCVLYSEVEFLLRQELREAALYNTLIEAIALGNTQLNDIYTKTQIDKAKISVYLKNLIALEILRREFPVLSGDKEKAVSARGLYRITDNFFRFWFRFVFTSLSDLEAGDAEGVYRHFVFPQLNAFAAPVFEHICRAFTAKQNREGRLPFRAVKVGRWWGKSGRIEVTETGKVKRVPYETEIDVMAADKGAKNILLGECKFRNSEITRGEFEKLAEKYVPEKVKICYSLFSKSGFSQRLMDEARKNQSLSLYTLADILRG